MRRLRGYIACIYPWKATCDLGGDGGSEIIMEGWTTLEVNVVELCTAMGGYVLYKNFVSDYDGERMYLVKQTREEAVAGTDEA